MYQITDATFAEARRYCIREHAVAMDDECWFNGTYMRVVPSHAVEMTSAYLDRRVALILARRKLGATAAQKQSLATVIHLCGAAAGDAYARAKFQVSAGQRCGSHDLAAYLARVNSMKRVFLGLAASL